MAEKAAQEGRVRGDKSAATTVSTASEKPGSFEVESAIRCKARMERHQRTVERAAKALAEKNLRDVIASESRLREMLAEALDAEIRRWSNGKEGNLRPSSRPCNTRLISSCLWLPPIPLWQILGPESGWQPISLTEVLTAPAVKRAYRKQRGASIQHKYICEKVFDLLKEAWNRFNSEER
ncbi:unnamed protein product [Spirodela intermedia]|uniref:Uncharacterized protein n=1 Tax=Spirodela intermedia TaxID=51605 RepID=A0A7I8ITS8_SPIIN|nr:unnamed protein product [Spirodela intermedia]CAA6661375.1 unnamed protein product [Spirodela intermedia]